MNEVDKSIYMMSFSSFCSILYFPFALLVKRGRIFVCLLYIFECLPRASTNRTTVFSEDILLLVDTPGLVCKYAGQAFKDIRE